MQEDKQPQQTLEQKNSNQLSLGNFKSQINQELQQNYERLQNIQQKKHKFHMLVNSKSGGCSGKKFLNIKNKNIQCILESKKNKKSEIIKYDAEIYFYDLYNEEEKSKGLKLMNEQVKQEENQCYCIVAGGDGSVLWGVDEMVKNQCDFQKIPVGIIAIGTGNDFSRATGWGGEEGISRLLEKDFKNLKKLMIKWVESCFSKFDLWDFKIELFENGYFQQIQKTSDGKNVKAIMKDSKTGQNLQCFERTMSNYFSIGVDARAGYGFDKHRTESRSKNKCVYVWEGLKKIFFKKTKNIEETLDELVEIKDYEQNSQQKLSDQKLESSNLKSQVLFSTKSSINTQSELKENQDKLQDKQSRNILMGQPSTIAILNINSISAGIHGLWEHSEGKYGVKQQDGDKQNKYKVPDFKYCKQQFGDKKLEMVSFSNLASMISNRFINGLSKRVAQGSGPFQFKYKQFDDKKQLLQTYFQIDGEYFSVKGAKSITVSQTKKMKGGQVMVMVENQFYQKENGIIQQQEQK